MSAPARVPDPEPREESPANSGEVTLDRCVFAALLLDSGGRVAAVSDAARALLGDEPTASPELAAFLYGDAGHGELTFEIAQPDGQIRTIEARRLAMGAAGDAVFLHDHTDEHALRDLLIESRKRYKDLVDISSAFAWETGPDGAFVFVSPPGALGFAAEQLLGAGPRGLMPFLPPGAPALPFEAQSPLTDFEIWMTTSDGEQVCLMCSAVPLFDVDGAWRGARGVCRDVTAARAHETRLAAMHDRERRMAYILGAVNEMADADEILNAAARATAHTFGAAACRLFRGAESPEPVAAFGQAPDTPLELPIADGVSAIPETTGVWLQAATRHNGAVSGLVRLWRTATAEPWNPEDEAFLADVRHHIALVVEQAVQRKELHRLSATDPLTGLENRRSFFDAISERLAAVAGGVRAADRRPAALLYVDLDNFKQVNDHLGHQAGDDALKAVADLLRRGLRDGDRVARLGGDEFALWLEGADGAGAEAKAKGLLEASVSLRSRSPDGAPPLGFSIGAAVLDAARGESLGDFVARADAAMYAAKNAGKGTFVLLDAADFVPETGA